MEGIGRIGRHVLGPVRTVLQWPLDVGGAQAAGGHEEQARCYRAFMETWKDDIGKGKDSVVGGAIWWEWMNVPGGPDDYNYIPKGKPAEQELRKWFAKARQNRSSLARKPEVAAEKTAAP